MLGFFVTSLHFIEVDECLSLGCLIFSLYSSLKIIACQTVRTVNAEGKASDKYGKVTEKGYLWLFVSDVMHIIILLLYFYYIIIILLLNYYYIIIILSLCIIIITM